MRRPNQCVAVVWARGVAASQHGGALAVGDEDLSTAFVPHSRSDNNVNIELGATRYFAPRVVEHLFLLFILRHVQEGDGARRYHDWLQYSSLEGGERSWG